MSGEEVLKISLMETKHGASYPFIIIHPDFATNFDCPALAELTDRKRIQPIWVFRGEFGGMLKSPEKKTIWQSQVKTIWPKNVKINQLACTDNVALFLSS